MGIVSNMATGDIYDETCKFCNHPIGVRRNGTEHKWGEWLMGHEPRVRLPEEASWKDTVNRMRKYIISDIYSGPFGSPGIYPGYINHGYYYFTECWCGCDDPRPTKIFCQHCGKFYNHLNVVAHGNSLEDICEDCSQKLVPIVLEMEGAIQHFTWKSKGE